MGRSQSKVPGPGAREPRASCSNGGATCPPELQPPRAPPGSDSSPVRPGACLAKGRAGFPVRTGPGWAAAPLHGSCRRDGGLTSCIPGHPFTELALLGGAAPGGPPRAPGMGSEPQWPLRAARTGVRWAEREGWASDPRVLHHICFRQICSKGKTGKQRNGGWGTGGCCFARTRSQDFRLAKNNAVGGAERGLGGAWQPGAGQAGAALDLGRTAGWTQAHRGTPAAPQPDTQPSRQALPGHSPHLASSDSADSLLLDGYFL